MLKNKFTTKEIFEDIPVSRALLVLSMPAIISQLVTLAYNIADTFFIGLVNNPLMVTGTSLTFPIYMMSAPISIIAGTGGGTLISRLLGQHRDGEAKKVGVFSTYVSLALGALFASLAIVDDLTIALFVIGGVFVAEMFCVVVQQVSVRLFHKRVFSYTPIHYAFVLKGYKETKIVYGFYLVAIVLAILGLIIGLNTL